MSSIRNNSSIKNGAVGSESQKLFDIINEMICSIEAKDSASLLEKLEVLENGLCAYFATEKNIASTPNSDFPQQSISHQSLLNKIKRIKDGLIAANCNHSKHEAASCVDSLWYYLLQHIEEDENLLKFLLNTDFRDFESIRVDSIAPASHWRDDCVQARH